MRRSAAIRLSQSQFARLALVARKSGKSKSRQLDEFEETHSKFDVSDEEQGK